MKAHRMILFMAVLSLASCASPKNTAKVVKSKSPAPQAASIQADRLEHSKALVTMTFEGLFLFSINPDRQMEIGALKHEHHQFEMKIRKITPRGASVVNLPVDAFGDIWIDAA